MFKNSNFETHAQKLQNNLKYLIQFSKFIFEWLLFSFIKNRDIPLKNLCN